MKTGGHSVGDRRQGDRQQDYCKVLCTAGRQAGRPQAVRRQADRQTATDRQATSVLATGDLEIKLDLTVFVKFHSRVSLSSYRMKFVWPESIQGLGQHAGKLNLEIDCTFAGWV